MLSLFKRMPTNATETQILSQLNSIKGQLNQMALDLTALKNAAQKETTVEQSAVALLTQLSAQIQSLIASSGSPDNTVNVADLQTIVDQLNSNATTLANAVAANTTAGNVPEPPPPPPPPAPVS